MPARRKTSVQNSDDVYVDDDYQKKRKRNNLAVKKCRENSTKKAEETKIRTSKLKEENLKLEGKVGERKNNIRYLIELLKETIPKNEQGNGSKLHAILSDLDEIKKE